MLQTISNTLLRNAARLSISVFFVFFALSPLVAKAAFIRIDVNYALDWVAGETDPEATVVIYLKNSSGADKDDIVLTAEPDGSFVTDCGLWASGTCPDIAVGDSVLAQVGSPPVTETLVDPIRQITVWPDENLDTVSGVVDVGSLAGDLAVFCMAWNETDSSTVTGTMDPQQEGGYSCDFGGSWDLQRGDSVLVAFVLPDGNRVMNMATWPWFRVNYGQESVGANYESGHTILVTVADSGGSTKATATAMSQPEGGVEGDGFDILPEQWDPAVPDIVPGDKVIFLVDNGFSYEINIGTITGNLDAEADKIEGTVVAEDFNDLPELLVECHPWGAWEAGLGDVAIKRMIAGPAGPEGDRSYSCDWSGEWDLVPGQRIAVFYFEPDNDLVGNVFWDPAPHLVLEDLNALGTAGEGGNLALNILALNLGDAVAESSLITLTLENMTYLSDTSGFSSATTTVPEGQQVTWDLGTFTEGAILSFTVFVSVDGTAKEILNATAQIETANSYDAGFPFEKYREWSSVIAPNSTYLVVQKHAWTPDPAPGNDFVWEVVACNIGETSSSEISLVDVLPDDAVVSFVDWWATDPGWVETPRTEAEISFTFPTIPGGLCSPVYLRFLVDELAEIGTSIVNAVEVSAPGDLSGGAAVSDELFIGEPHTNLRIEKRWQSGQLTPGGALSYRIHIANTGNLPVAGYQEPGGDPVVLAVIDTLPVKTSYVEARFVDYVSSMPITPLIINTEGVVFQLPDLDNGFAGHLEITAQIDPSAQPGTSLINTAQICLFNTVDAECLATPPIEEDSLEDNISIDAQVINDHGSNLRISKEHEWLAEQQQLFYRIRFENIGDVTVPNVTVRDTYPVDTSFNGEFESDSGEIITGFNHVPDGNLITWSLESLDPRQTGVIHFLVSLDNPALSRFYTNFVEILPAEDVNPGDNAYENVAFKAGIGSVHLKLGEQVLLGTGLPGRTVTVTTFRDQSQTGQFQAETWECPPGHFYPDDVALGGCWNFDAVAVIPGDVVQLNVDEHTVNFEVPDPFTLHASSFSNTVSGRIDNLDAEWVWIYAGLGPEVVAEAVIQTDSFGNFEAEFADLPESCWAEVFYPTSGNYARITFHRMVMCSGDIDGDGVPDEEDNCPDLANSNQLDTDGDDTGDACDVCPDVADDQSDADEDGIGDICDNFPHVPIMPGDINNDGDINVVDVILALKVASNIGSPVSIFKAADVSGDDKIGLEEAIYVLEAVSDINQLSDFIGTFNFSEQYDLNISNGVLLNLGSVLFEVSQIDAKNIHLQGTVTNPDEGTFSFELPLAVSGNKATLFDHPYPIPGGSGNLLEMLLLSDGNNMVYTSVGQEAGNLADISLSVANWVRTPTEVTIDSFVGTWSGVFYTDPNLSNTTDGFTFSYQFGIISKVDSDTISITIDNEPLFFDVVNNRATLANAPATTTSAVYHAISMVTDGTGLSWYLVATELSDPTDVSVDIGLLTKQ